MVRAIEAQQPLWPPGSAYEYHAHVFGFLIGEPIRRITGLDPGAYFRKVIGDARATGLIPAVRECPAGRCAARLPAAGGAAETGPQRRRRWDGRSSGPDGSTRGSTAGWRHRCRSRAPARCR
ncbi:serine hydrolase [Streptomyces sp. NBC_00344]|uniref:serine hydrolase n=1 Tax=Streptomyces sp. NBC_00344 TaxID=2975720 RepID=UPI003FA6D09B